MPKQEKGAKENEESESSTSQSSAPSGDDERRRLLPGSKPKEEKESNPRAGQRKRFSEISGETSGSAPRSISHLSKKGLHDQGKESPSKMRYVEKDSMRKRLIRSDAMECNCDEDSAHELTCPLNDLGLKDESSGAEPKETSSGESRPSLGAIPKKRKDRSQFSDPSGHPSSATEPRQIPEMSRLQVPGTSSEVTPTSPSKRKGPVEYIKGVGKGLVNLFTPTRSSDTEGNSGGETDPKPKRKSIFNKSPKGKSPNRIPGKTSSSGSPASKRSGNSSTDSTLPSSSASDPNAAESPRPAKKSPKKFKTRAASSSVSTGSDSLPGSPNVLPVPPVGGGRGSGGSRSPSPSRRSRSRSRSRSGSPPRPCTCGNSKPRDTHEPGCPKLGKFIRQKNNRSAAITYNAKRYKETGGSSKP